MDRQPDLFDLRGRVLSRQGQRPVVPDAGPAVAPLTDDELVATIPEADLSNVEALCAEVVSRSLQAAVPALERLWGRFAGFGRGAPLLEQRAVLGTLAQLDGEPARDALKGIVLSKSLPASLIPAALRAAADAGLTLPAALVASHLRHEDVAVREPAFRLSVAAGVPAHLLRDGLSDPSASVRRAAAIAMGNRGDAEARQPLLDELARQPTTEVIEALAVIWDDDVIVLLGRCAELDPAHRSAVLDVLRDIESPRAQRLARRLEVGSRVSGSGNS